MDDRALLDLLFRAIIILYHVLQMRYKSAFSTKKIEIFKQKIIGRFADDFFRFLSIFHIDKI